MDQLPEKVEQKALEYLDKIIVPSLQQVGGIISDQVRLWRYKNQIKILNKATALHQKYGISLRKIPVKTLASFMEYSSLEEDETLQNLWVNLLVNATDKENSYYEHHSLISILKEVNKAEALTLQYLCNLQYSNHFSKTLLFVSENVNVFGFKFDHNNKVHFELRELLLNNLMRLNLIEFDYKVLSRVLKSSERININDNYRVTSLGKRLIKECTIPLSSGCQRG